MFDYVEGGADEEIAIDANRQAFQRRKLNPQLLRDVSVTDLTGELFGHPFSGADRPGAHRLHAHDASDG